MVNQSFDNADVDDLYREIILDHYRNPRNPEKLPAADIAAEGMNPFCGDEVLLQIALKDGLVDAVGFQGVGCSISQASASILTELIKGKTLQEAEAVYLLFRDMMQGKETSAEAMEALGQAEALAGVKRFPIRIKCALLAWVTLEDGIKKHRQKTTAD